MATNVPPAVTDASGRATAAAIERLLEAIESRDLRRISRALAPDATWQNVPSGVVAGRDDVLALLAGIVCWSDEVRWDVVSAATSGDTGWYERIDRFWIDGVEHAVRCNGVFTVADGRVSAVRDYVDLAEWRSRIGPVYERLAARDASTVVARHLDAVRRRDPIAMAADYALDAKLIRDDDQYVGWVTIADYFDTVPERLGPRTLEFVDMESNDRAHAAVAWRITDRDQVVASGRDRYVVNGGRIVEQVVQLDSDDF